MLSANIDQSIKRFSLVAASVAALCGSIALFVSAFPVIASETRSWISPHYSLGYYPVSRGFSDFGAVDPLRPNHAHVPSRIGPDGLIG